MKCSKLKILALVYKKRIDQLTLKNDDNEEKISELRIDKENVGYEYNKSEKHEKKGPLCESLINKNKHLEEKVLALENGTMEENKIVCPAPSVNSGLA